MTGSFPDIKDIPSCTADELMYAESVGAAVASGKMSSRDPNEAKLLLQSDSGEVDTISFTDVPENRAAFAIKDQFADQPGKFPVVMMRMFALHDLMQDQRMNNYIRPSDEPDTIEICTEVFTVAAEMPLNAKRGFNKQKFFRRVAALVRANDD